MRLTCAALVSVLSLLLAGCGQVEPVLMPVSMPDCIYQGPSAMTPGEARVSLTLNGIGDGGVLLVELADDRIPPDLANHLEATDGDWSERPAWVFPLLELRLASSQGLDGVEETISLTEGDYALVCVDHSDDSARLAGGVAVAR